MSIFAERTAMSSPDNLNAAIKELLQLPDTADAIGRGYELVLEISGALGKWGRLTKLATARRKSSQALF
jgi:hypothetical protein